jgi:glycerophosphoryl diester phosphodiesterase
VALAALPAARFNIDIKALAAAEETARLIERFGARDRVLVSSFGAKRRLAALAAMPGVATSADSSRVILLRLGLALRNKKMVERALEGLDAVQIPTHLGPIRLDSKSLIDACRERGVEVHYWTINDPHEAKRLRSLGADGIVTDRCKLMVMELAE